MATLHVVEQPAGGRDHDIDPVLQGAGLRLHAHAAVNGYRADLQVTAVSAGALEHLLGQLARGHEHQRPEHVLRAVRGEPLQDRQHERRRLAGAGLGGSDEIASGQGQGDGFQLNGGGLLVAFVGHGAHQFGDEPQ